MTRTSQVRPNAAAQFASRWPTTMICALGVLGATLTLDAAATSAKVEIQNFSISVEDLDGADGAEPWMSVNYAFVGTNWAWFPALGPNESIGPHQTFHSRYFSGHQAISWSLGAHRVLPHRFRGQRFIRHSRCSVQCFRESEHQRLGADLVSCRSKHPTRHLRRSSNECFCKCDMRCNSACPRTM